MSGDPILSKVQASDEGSGAQPEGHAIHALLGDEKKLKANLENALKVVREAKEMIASLERQLAQRVAWKEKFFAANAVIAKHQIAASVAEQELSEFKVNHADLQARYDQLLKTIQDVSLAVIPPETPE